MEKEDLLLFVNVDVEPKTKDVDELTARVRSFSSRWPDALVGIGGGSTMDIAKAVSVMLANPGLRRSIRAGTWSSIRPSIMWAFPLWQGPAQRFPGPLC